MSEWWTYSLSDFLMFSPRTYWRLFELYNRDLWPAQILALAGGAALPLLAWTGRPWQQRWLTLLLAAAWAWTAWGFLYARYDTINWAGRYLAAIFAIEALLLVGLGVATRRLQIGPVDTAASRASLALFLAILIFYPFISVVSGRSWMEAEFFGLAPDPTAIGTLALLLTAHGRASLALLVIPLLWCLFSGATLWTMEAWEAVLPLGTALLLVASLALRPFGRTTVTM